MKKNSVDKDQLIALGFLISFILIGILIAYIVINTKAVDKLINRVEELENKLGTNNNNNNQEEQPLETYSTDNFKVIMPSDIKNESKDETIVVLWARKNCGYCVAYVPIISEVAEEHNVKIRYIDMASIVDLSTWEPSNVEEHNIMSSLTGDGEWQNYGAQIVDGTPGTMFIRKGKVIGGLIGYWEKGAVEEAFKKAGL